jgi:hypothetical protein
MYILFIIVDVIVTMSTRVSGNLSKQQRTHTQSSSGGAPDSIHFSSSSR